MRSANVHQAKTQLSRLIAAAISGEEVVITRNGVAAVRLVPVQAEGPRRQGGFWKGKVVETDPEWWKPDDELADLFGVPKLPDPEPHSP